MTANELAKKNHELRDELIKTLQEKRDEVVKIYYQDPDTIEDGWITLQRSYIVTYIDDHTNEVVRLLHTIEDMGNIDTGYDFHNLYFRDMSNEVLIELIGEMEDMIEKNELIEINEE